jgi:hypothetical protein
MEMPMPGGGVREETELENLGCNRDSAKGEKAGETGAEESAEAGEVGICGELQRSCEESIVFIFDPVQEEPELERSGGQ